VKVALQDLPPLALGVLRFGVAGALLFGLLLVIERDVRVAPRDAPRLILMGLLSIAINQALFLDGMRRTSASIGAIMFACASAFTILLAVFLLGERAAPRLWAGVALATAGIALIAGVGGAGDSPAAPLGDLEVFLSALAVGVSALLARDVLRRYSALRVTAWTAVSGVLCLATVNPATVSVNAWAALAYSSTGASVGTIVLWNYGLARVGVTRATVYGYLQPVAGVALAALLLGDRLTSRQIVGGVVALLGTYLASSATFVVARTRHSAQAAPEG
jgi:drug/metabolite transporter (DMT)-like permease